MFIRIARHIWYQGMPGFKFYKQNYEEKNADKSRRCTRVAAMLTVDSIRWDLVEREERVWAVLSQLLLNTLQQQNC